MTVQNTTVKDIYVGNGATTKFPITFQMTDHPEYIKVYITGDDSVAVETENFSVDLGAKTVTYPANGDPLPEGHKITIYRELPLYQLMNLVNQGPFFAENIELSFDDLIFICQQLNEKLNRTLSAGIDVSNFNNTFPVKAGMSFRINDAGDGLVLTEDPARVLPLAKDVLEQTKQVKESAVNETTNIKNTAIEELTAIKDAAVNETTEIKDEAVAAKNTAVEAAATAAEDAVNNVQTLLDEKVAAAENAKSAAVSSAESALASKNAAAASQSSAAASAETAQASAESASSSANAALASKNAALTSENNAKASETKSAKSEENAKAAETAAENSKKSASDSASAASSSAESALESKTLAAASANSASASKTSAESSAESAASSATTATREADRAQDIADSLEGLAGITGIATTDEAIAGVVDNKAMTPLKTKEAIEQGTNVFTALNAFRANIIVSNGTAAGSQGQIVLGVKPRTATVQANIISSTTGALNYNATETTGHYFKIGNNIATTSITSNESETAIFSHNAFEFARITNVGVAKWLGNANTATKLETSRTINGVAFDGTKDIIVDSNPVGTIIAVAYTGVPEGYMHCNGAAVNRTTYVNLFNKIGTTYGAGDGSTTFNLPNTVARFLEGGIGAGTYYEAGLPNITGNISAFKSSISGAFVGSNNTNRYDGWNDNEDEYAVSTSFDASRSNSIYGASTTVQPPAMTVIYCIKY
ncbi:tail collar domain [Phascolarctobacterium faecium DSM 14760]|uniref:tail fiber protein n=1 Tax=Phascolarctobacterium faecium TaxID=33025 RepID=UPI000DC36A2F|nr:tail fiber protein [Phascolarctobacterium faecium]RAS52858.1 tail collar domain [Phascolarctobacterium faecium DSM 14760]